MHRLILLRDCRDLLSRHCSTKRLLHHNKYLIQVSCTDILWTKDMRYIQVIGLLIRSGQ